MKLNETIAINYIYFVSHSISNLSALKRYIKTKKAKNKTKKYLIRLSK